VFEYFRQFFGLFCWLLVWCLAFWRGRWPERTAAGGTLILGLFAFFVRLHTKNGDFDYQAFFTDSALFLLFLFIAVRANRIWPIPAAGFQFIAVLTHLAALVRNPGSAWAYLSVSILATWLVLITFVIGLWENELRRKIEREIGQADAPPI
jgi:peptidoglycan/LPS O-acetylase OafA/YrhL